ncbi:iron dicitrate transport regulator FecR [Lampropedia puyangensis]|uniref:Iron dicitrate transport regulator FecR n=1 Tax=Lampropedia puyangensis TaxID=1330072 RepID=A0A4S8FCM1_9BURK|nr:FecR domain-containing protein [Lampropedia puyangensis]THU05107.1 iron dicitrate transport regulator FecR [Lampropedia puyangensis]
MTKLTPELAQRHQRAADYFVRRREPGWTGTDEHELNIWLNNYVNRGIFEDLGRMSIELRQITRPRLASDVPPQATADRVAPDRQKSADKSAVATSLAKPSTASWRFGRRALVPALLSVLLVTSSSWYWWDNHASYELNIATGPAETREVDLPDGSRIALNFSTSLRIRYYPRHRETTLTAGEAFFRVAPDARRPFTVDSGSSQVRVVGTAFNVRAAPPRLVVKVLEGKVEVRPDRTRETARTLLLSAGAGVSIDPATGQHTAVAAPAGTVGDWRNGQLVYEQTPLADVAADLARYLGEPVVVEGEKLGKLPVSGMVITSSPAAFLRALPDLLPVRVNKSARGGWRISPRG